MAEKQELSFSEKRAKTDVRREERRLLLKAAEIKAKAAAEMAAVHAETARREAALAARRAAELEPLEKDKVAAKVVLERVTASWKWADSEDALKAAEAKLEEVESLEDSALRFARARSKNLNRRQQEKLGVVAEDKARAVETAAAEAQKDLEARAVQAGKAALRRAKDQAAWEKQRAEWKAAKAKSPEAKAELRKAIAEADGMAVAAQAELDAQTAAFETARAAHLALFKERSHTLDKVKKTAEKGVRDAKLALVRLVLAAKVMGQALTGVEMDATALAAAENDLLAVLAQADGMEAVSAGVEVDPTTLAAAKAVLVAAVAEREKRAAACREAGAASKAAQAAFEAEWNSARGKEAMRELLRNAERAGVKSAVIHGVAGDSHVAGTGGAGCAECRAMLGEHA